MQGVVRDQVAERVREPTEERVVIVLGKHVMEHLGELPVRLDERVGADGLRLVHGRCHELAIGRELDPLEFSRAVR